MSYLSIYFLRFELVLLSRYRELYLDVDADLLAHPQVTGAAGFTIMMNELGF